MNLIADNLFSLLLGWTRSLFNNLWNLITNNGGGFMGFLQRFWLPILILLVLAGTFFDFFVWLIRWRPYYVWSTRLRMRANRRHLSKTSSYMEDLDHSPLDLPEYQHDENMLRQELVDEPVYFEPVAPYEPAYYPPVEEMPEPYYQQEPMPPPVEEPAFVPNLPWQPIINEMPVVQDSVPEFQYQDLVQEPVNEDPTYTTNETYLQNQDIYNAPLFDVDNKDNWTAQNAEELQSATGLRRRRTEARRQRGNVLKSLKDTFFTSEEDQSPIDSIQPPVNQQDAFHKPYYPQGYNYKEQSNQTPPQDQGNP